MLVSPELASATDASLNLVNHEEDAKLVGQVTHALCELTGQVVVTTFRLNGLNNNSANFTALLNAPLFNF